jgi:hypothetical protein
MSSLQLALAYLIALAGLFGVAIYLSIRFTSGRFDSTRLPDVVLVGASALSLCFVPWADLIDGSALVVYALILLSIRLFVLKRSFRSPETVLYLALLYISLSRLDKVEGYGHPNQFLVIAQYLFLACIVSSCIYLVSKNANREAILALALLMFPVSHLPLELLRNAVARHLTEHVSHLYVTKLYATDIYGLRFEKKYWVDRISSDDGQFRRSATELLNDGGGTLDPQIPIISSWEFAIVRNIYGKSAS